MTFPSPGGRERALRSEADRPRVGTAENFQDHIDVIEDPYMWYYVAIPA